MQVLGEDFRLFGLGDFLALKYDDQYLTFEAPFVTSLTINMQRQYIDCTELGSPPQVISARLAEVDLHLKLTGPVLFCESVEEIERQLLDFIKQQTSIQQLIKLLGEKARERV